MLIHYLGFAIRLLRRSPLYAVLTIGGLAIALASCILIAMFIRHEVGYDAWLPNAERTYRIHLTLSSPGRESRDVSRALGPMRDLLASDSDVEAIGRLAPLGQLALEHDGRVVTESIMTADPQVFDVLDLPVVRGRRELADPSAALVTEEVARIYFGDADPIGRTLTLLTQPRIVLRVDGVLRDIPAQSHLALGIVTRIDASNHPEWVERLQSWRNVVAFTYLRLRPGADPAQLQQRITALLQERVPDIQAGNTKLSGRDLFRPFLVAVRDLHLNDTTLDAEMKPRGDATTLYAIGGVAVLLLLIAIGNFLNLATARAGRRAREIAIRKAAGAEPRDIIVQYLGEAVLIALCALVVALMLVELTLPWFEQLAGRALASPHDPALLGVLAGGAIVLGVISGSYPAIVLSRYRPAIVMNQNQASLASGSGRLRAVLVFAQFAAAIGLLLATGVVYRQARFAANADLGFAKHDRLIVTGIYEHVREAIHAWVEQAERVPGVVQIALSSETPADDVSRNTLVEVPGDPEHSGSLRATYVDPDFFQASAIRPLAGRVFSRDIPTDDSSTSEPAPGREGAMILNAAAVRRLGLGTPAQAIGKDLRAALFNFTAAPFRVVGVVPDVHFDSVRRAVEPTVFVCDRNWFARATVHFEPGTGPAVRAELAALWSRMFPDRPFHAELLETNVDAQYRNERRLAAILTAAALLALAVACLGLYGLSSFMLESRKKEIAIRKVLGASTLDVLRLLARQLARPVALACVIAAPIAYLASERWLAGFAYRISVGPLWTVGTVAVAIAIAAATVAIQSLRSARSLPGAALRGDQ